MTSALPPVEKGVPIPSRRGAPPKYGFDRLDIGDSILCPDNNVRAAARMWARRFGRKFTIRKLKDGTGYRVWRVE